MDDSGAAHSMDLFGHADAGSARGHAPAPTQRQMAYALDISRTLRVPMPLDRDAAGVGAFIDLHREALKALRGRR